MLLEFCKPRQELLKCFMIHKIGQSKCCISCGRSFTACLPILNTQG